MTSHQAEAGVAGFTPGPWREYGAEKPTAAGVYEWRVPSARVAGLTVRCLAHFEMRNAGYQKVLSPAFDYWDGYRLHVPAGTEWREAAEGHGLKQYEQRFVCAEGVELEPCPFCRQVPKLVGIERASGGGVYCSSDAHRYNSFWLECCSWAKSPHFSDPRKLAEARHAALKAVSP